MADVIDFPARPAGADAAATALTIAVDGAPVFTVTMGAGQASVPTDAALRRAVRGVLVQALTVLQAVDDEMGE